jgi:hypothetical protein
MKASRGIVFAAAALLAASGLAACGEREQVVVYKQGKYQGKPDAQPWQSDPSASLHTSSKWTQGDKTSWEAAIRTRNQNQNEYSRVP